MMRDDENDVLATGRGSCGLEEPLSRLGCSVRKESE
jgi:hypothetical protein